MKTITAIVLQVVIVLIGVGALVFLLGEPHLEGRNAHATLYQIYFRDPFLAYAYLASIPFFVALYQSFKALEHARQGQAFSAASARALRITKYCALSIIGFAAGGELLLLLNESDDRAGGVFMGILVTVGSLAIATTAAAFERRARSPGHPPLQPATPASSDR